MDNNTGNGSGKLIMSGQIQKEILKNAMSPGQRLDVLDFQIETFKNLISTIVSFSIEEFADIEAKRTGIKATDVGYAEQYKEINEIAARLKLTAIDFGNLPPELEKYSGHVLRMYFLNSALTALTQISNL